MRNYLPFIVFIALVVAVSFLPLSAAPRIILLVILALGFLFFRRNVFYYYHANSLMQVGKTERAMKWFERACRAGLSADGKITVASMYIQFDDARKGREILDSVISSPEKYSENQYNIARILLALVTYREEDREKGIAMLEEIHRSGCRNTSLALDLMTVYLDGGETRKAKEIWKEYKDLSGTDLGLDDCHGRLLIIEGKWEEAYSLYAEMAQRDHRAANEFVHIAQTLIHYGEVGKALQALSIALSCTFNRLNPFRKEMVSAMYDALKNPETRVLAAHVINENPALVASGVMPPLPPNHHERSEAETLEGFAVLKKDGEGKKQRADRMPDTSLDESDEAYLARHGYL